MNKKQAIGTSVIGALALVILLLTVTGVRAEPDVTLPAAPAIPAAQADVVSPTISYQGRLLDGEDNPVHGTTVMTFSLYAEATGGSSLWQDRLYVPVNEGLFEVTLAVNPALFNGQALWLGVRVEGDIQELRPRRQLLPVPYAFHALTARWSGLMDVPPSLLDGDNDTIYTPGPGLILAGNEFAIDTTYRLPQGCGGDQVAKWNDVGDSWYCADDDDTTYIPGLGLILTDDAFEISATYRLPQNCGDGQIAEWDANASTWHCGSDDVGGGASAWLLGGNAGTAYDADFLGTTDAVSLTLIAGGGVALRLEPTGGTPNLLGGIDANWTTAGVSGATIGGGGSGGSGANRVTDDYGTVGGGGANRAGDANSFATDATYATVGGGYLNTAAANQATVGGGGNNHASGRDSTVGGGEDNYATGGAATVAGGNDNVASGSAASVGGGRINTASGVWATVSGGSHNTTSGYGAVVGGGITNTATFTGTTIGGGESNVISATHGTIAGGRDGTVTGDYASIGGGWDNTASGNLATIGGGDSNTASGEHATIGGGGENHVFAPYGTIAGGYDGTVAGNYAAVGGGYYNSASAAYAIVGGGLGNSASGQAATVAGGYHGTITGDYAAVGGGVDNTASAAFAAVGGGVDNTASGNAATVVGGASNTASGDYSFAAGHGAQANHAGAFVWGDNTTAAINSSAANQFIVRANDGIWFGEATGALTPTIGANVFISTTTGAYLSTGGAWTNASDSGLKESFAAVDGQEVLARLAEVPITTWNYKAEDPSILHMGPTAQDFNTAFGLGGSETSIGTVDADGVALAAIQGLYAQNQALEKENTALREQLSSLETRLAALEQRAEFIEGTAVDGTSPARPLQSNLLPGAGIALVGLMGLAWLRRKSTALSLPEGGAR